MDYFQAFRAGFRNRLMAAFLVNNVLIIAAWLAIEQWWHPAEIINAAVAGGLAVILTIAVPWLVTRPLTKPTKLIWQTILHLAPGADNIAAPDPEAGGFGHELVSNLSNHIFQLASNASQLDTQASSQEHDLAHNAIASSLPLPLFVVQPDDVILFANQAALDYIGAKTADVIGQNIYAVLDLSFQSDETLDNWLADAKQHAATATHSWERVRLTLAAKPDQPGERRNLRFDLAAYYNRNNPLGYETMLVLFDHDQAYSQDDQAVGFVALAVHELRTPLTLLRGYAEALDENLAGRLDDENAGLLTKMNAAGQQLAAFVNNILNVARIDDDQFLVQLHEEKWPEILESAVADMRLRAQVRGIQIDSDIAQDLPPVGIDRLSIYEVICNLLDNAIKYSGDSRKIVVSSRLSDDGLIETTVQDFGVGIPEAVMPGLFEKFYRNHRNRAQIGGTGLGLYVCKTIISAHGGHIWVRSKEGQGANFSFTVQPYAKLAENLKQHPDDGLDRTAHGWIKNHSLYRR